MYTDLKIPNDFINLAYLGITIEEFKSLGNHRPKKYLFSGKVWRKSGSCPIVSVSLATSPPA
jgi:hypothetical protein